MSFETVFLRRIIYFIAYLFLVSACISKNKLLYLKDSGANYETMTMVENQPEEYRLQPGDIVSVMIKTLDVESSEPFNLHPLGSIYNLNDVTAYLHGHSLDDSGKIQLPEVGLIHLGGLSLGEAKNAIEESISVYLSKASVFVKLMSFSISVLGEVENPGEFTIYRENASIFQGLSLAGDLKDFANRKRVLLIRNSGSGPGSIFIDLQDPNLLSSPFYYLRPNDVLYVEPLKAKTAKTNLDNLNVVGFVLGAVTTSIFVLSLFVDL